MFALLWSAKARPDIFEDPSRGGPDFCCNPDKRGKFLVEVTSLESGAVSRRSHLPDRIDPRGGGGAFGLITAALDAAARSKASQLANWPYPRVLAITSSHAFAHLFMDRLPAQNLLLSDPMISVPIGDPNGRETMTTDLRKAVFFRLGKTGNRIVPIRQSISAILLVSISCSQAEMVGILHPEPAVRFDPSLFPKVPYLRVKNWPIINGRILTEWIADTENPTVFYHQRIR